MLAMNNFPNSSGLPSNDDGSTTPVSGDEQLRPATSLEQEKGSTDGSSSTCGGTSGVGTSLDDSLHALLENILPRKDYMPDKSQIFTFLLSARMFCSPAELLQEILQHCIYEQNSAGVNYRKDLRTKFARSVVHFLLEWVVSFPYDFLDSKMSERLNEFLDICCCVDPTLHAVKFNILQGLVKRISKLKRYEKALGDLRVQNQQRPTTSLSNVSIMKKCPEASLLAQQLTHIEMERMSMIGPEEFVYYCLAKKPCPQVSKENTCQRRVTHNIDHYLEWCNRLTYLVATEICRHVKKKVRTRAMEFFIDVAKECFNIGNFNSLIAIIGGMNLGPVARLVKTRARLDESKLKVLEIQLDPSCNFYSYRSTLKAAIWRATGATNQTEKVIVPIFGLFLRDAMALVERCTKVLPDGALDYMMFSQLSEVIQPFLRWKSETCPFGKNESVLQHVLTCSILDETELQQASFDCEPAESQVEKELYKQLKEQSTNVKF